MTRSIALSSFCPFITTCISKLCCFLIKKLLSVSSTLWRTNSFNSCFIAPSFSCIILSDMVRNLLWRFLCCNLILPNGYVHVILLDFYEFAKLIVPYLTTNLEFGQWTTVFGDNKLTAALVDRLVHHAHILTFTGDSLRLKEAMKRTQI